MIKKIFIGLLVVIGLFLAIQLAPYGRDHTNPPVIQEMQWSSPEARQAAVRSCYDCHSNETVWPWYSSVAPMSWLIQHDVDEGREHLNFSDINARHHHGSGELEEVLAEGEMPPAQYLVLHPAARLTEAERQLLMDNLAGLSAGTGSGETDGGG